MKNEIQDKRNIFWFMIGSIALFFGMYIYFLGHTIFTVVARQNVEKSISSLSRDVEKLETKYFTLKSHVTSDLAISKGFTAIAPATYISRSPVAKGLTLNNEI
ncbi:MAG: hypothetical protein V4467_00215 [Patescibacteria group bacterium]